MKELLKHTTGHQHLLIKAAIVVMLSVNQMALKMAPKSNGSMCSSACTPIFVQALKVERGFSIEK